MSGIYVGSVLYRNIHVGFAESMAKFQRVMDRDGVNWQYGSVSNDALVSRSRSIVASHFLRSDCDVLLTIDSDIWFRPEDALKLVEECRNGHDLIGALYVTRGLNQQPAAMLPDEDVVFHGGARPVRAPFISTGFMAVHRKVFEHLKQDLPLCHQGWNDRGEDTSFWPFYMPFCIPWEGDGFMYLSEDWALCQRAKSAGYDRWLDPSIRLQHYGEVAYTLEDLGRSPRIAPAPLKLLRAADGTLSVYAVEQQKAPTR